MTIIEAVKEFVEWRNFTSKPRTINGYVRDIIHFCIYLRTPSYDVENLTLRDCLEWLKLLEALGYDRNSLQKKAIALKMFFEFLRKSDINVLDPERIPIPQRVFRFPRVANEEDYKKLLSVIPENGGTRGPRYWEIRDKALIMILHDTGARNGEIVSLDIEDLNLESDPPSARIKTEKSRGTVPFREIFRSKETNEVLKKWLAARQQLSKKIEFFDPQAIFIGIKSGRFTPLLKGKRLQINYVSEILRKLSNKAGLPMPINPHSLRHSFGRKLVKNGADAFVVSSLLGHSRIESSYPYTMLFGKDREEMYKKYTDD